MKHILFLLLITSIASFGQNIDDAKIEQKIIKQLPEVLNTIQPETDIIVIDNKQFQSISKLDMVDLRDSTSGLDTYVLIEVLYSTYNIQYSYFKDNRLIKATTKNF